MRHSCPRFWQGSVGEIDLDDPEKPYYLKFAPDAQELFIEYFTKLELRLRAEKSDDSFITEHLSKFRSLIPSLALIIYLVDGGRREVCKNSLEKAIKWGEYLESHANRVYHTISPQVNHALILAQKLVNESKITSPFTLRDIVRNNWKNLNDKILVQEVLSVLCQKGWLTKRLSVSGKTTEYLINPKIKEIDKSYYNLM